MLYCAITLSLISLTASAGSDFAGAPSDRLGSPLPRVWSSSEEAGNFHPQLAVDGNPNTRWSSSFNDDQFLVIELPEPMTIRSVGVHWNSADAKRFSIETSNDGVTYSPSTQRDLLGTGEGLQTIDLTAPVRTKFIRFDLVERSTQWGFSIHEVFVNGKPIAAEGLPVPPADAVFRDPLADPTARAADAVARMSLREKIRMLSGDAMFYFPANDRLGLSRLFFADASMGLRLPNSTAFPAFIALAASFDPDLAARYGDAVAEECRAKGVHVLLGPGVNLYRVPQGGRNFEYLGEDPFLASEMVVPYIKAVQKRGVMATVKHLVANNHEWHRKASNSVVDDATLRTLYYPAFKAAVQEADVGAVMTAYNLVNGEWAAQNRSLVQGVLRDEWGFDGLVMTDWWSVYDPLRVIKSGVNLEMPHADYLNEPAIITLLNAGLIEEHEIDQMVEGTLRAFFKFGFYDRDQTDPDAVGFGGWHDDVSLETARKGMALLRNEEGFLPLDPGMTGTIVMLGRNTRDTETGGYGAARVEPTNPISILESVRAQAGENARVLQFDEASAEATRAMQSADAVFVSFNTREREANDRDFELPEETLAMIEAATDASDRVGVIVTAGSGVDISPFVDDTKAILMAWFGGNVGNTAVGEILFGVTNPSGKLPFTIERTWSESPAYGRFLPEGAAFNDEPIWGRERGVFDVVYGEGAFSGYRHFAVSGTEPLFPFGHGLSYTSFEISDFRVSDSEGDRFEVQARVTNTGGRAGTEVVQVYIQSEIEDDGPMLQQLVGFDRVPLAAGASRIVTFSFTPEQGRRVRAIGIGNSSGNTPLVSRIDGSSE